MNGVSHQMPARVHTEKSSHPMLQRNARTLMPHTHYFATVAEGGVEGTFKWTTTMVVSSINCSSLIQRAEDSATSCSTALRGSGTRATISIICKKRGKGGVGGGTCVERDYSDILASTGSVLAGELCRVGATVKEGGLFEDGRRLAG
jgi:hypothetical protein